MLGSTDRIEARDALTKHDTTLNAITYEEIAGWAEDDHEEALRTFLKSCSPRSSLRPASAPSENLDRVCRQANGHVGRARPFFEAHFQPFQIVPPSGEGFLTGYFEPLYRGSPTPTEDCPTPILTRPSGEPPYPDRAAIEDGMLGNRVRALVYLDPTEAFIIHVQGSARILLPDGSAIRLGYAGRNGHPYSSIGNILIETGVIPLEEMNLERLLSWLKTHRDEARALMRRNRSYIFFRIADELQASEGPIGGAGVSLTAGRSLAVDRHLWSYGLPFWLDGTLPSPDGEKPLRRLMIAQDTGSAILGPARGDFYVGSGPEAGTVAGAMRHPTRFLVLLPRGEE